MTVILDAKTTRIGGPFAYPVTRAFLLICAALAVAVGGAILLSPHAFFATNHIALSNDPNLMSEVRAPGGLLIAAGLMMLAGAVFQKHLLNALRVAAITFSAYGLARCISWAADGAPSSSLMIALALEIGLGIIAAILLAKIKAAKPSPHPYRQ